LRFFDLQVEHPGCKQPEHSTFRVLGRHYRVLPQQLVANSLTDSSERRFCGAKPPFRSGRRTAQPVRLTRPKACSPSLRRQAGQTPSDSEAGMLEAFNASAVSNFSRSFGATPCAATSDSTTRKHRSLRASPEPEPKLGNGRFLEALTAAEAEVAATKLPFRNHTAEAECALEGTLGLRGSDPAHRSGSSRNRRPESCLPPASHRSESQAQDTQQESNDVSHGARFLSAYEPRRSLRRFTSPTPSALGVSHSLSGLSPPGPRGFVSRHIRP
jgi:hypothetical protein